CTRFIPDRSVKLLWKTRFCEAIRGLRLRRAAAGEALVWTRAPAPRPVIGSLARMGGQKILRACRRDILSRNARNENRSIVENGANARGLDMAGKIFPRIGRF